MPVTPLTAQECYLLERYSSLEYYGNMRDAWERMVFAAEELLDYYMNHLPKGYRKLPVHQQPDQSWGEMVMPNLRDDIEILRQGYIKLSHGDYSNWNGAAVNGSIRGMSDYSSKWMPKIDALEDCGAGLDDAAHYAGNIDPTANVSWKIGSLSTRYNEKARGPLNPPEVWPVYRLNPAIQVKTGGVVPEAGIYWPTAPDSAAQFLPPTIEGRARSYAPEANVGLSKSGLQFDHEEDTTWIKVERVPGDTIADGLANLLHQTDGAQRNVPGGQPCPRVGFWFTPADPSLTTRQFKEGDILPVIEGSSYGDTFWQWVPGQ